MQITMLCLVLRSDFKVVRPSACVFTIERGAGYFSRKSEFTEMGSKTIFMVSNYDFIDNLTAVA